MTELLMFREQIKTFYKRYEVFILPVVKFMFAFLVLNVLNAKIGYMSRLDNIAIVLIVSLLCSFLPVQTVVVFAAMFSLLHMYALSLETVLVGLVVYTVIFLLFLRFSTGESVVLLVTTLLCLIKIPYAVPIVMGLVGTPVSALAIGCGVVVYYLLRTITGEAANIATMGDEEMMTKIRLLVDGLLDNKAMLVLIAAFTITLITVYLIRKMSIDHAWTMAIAAGAIVDILVLLIGDLLYNTNVSVVNAILGTIVAVIVAKVVEFFRFCVDYSRTEKVQFEDDEYYYYVKAVPKMTVAAPTKTVKKINTASRPGGSVQAHRHSGSVQARGNGGRSRQTVERTYGEEHSHASAVQRSAIGRNTVPADSRQHLSGARSMTINSHMTENTANNEEELF